MFIVGIDNGVTGTVCCMECDDFTKFAKNIHIFNIPVKKVLDYTKKQRFINRINVLEFSNMINSVVFNVENNTQRVCAVLERPLNNPVRYVASMVAMRAFEATLIVLEQLKIPYEVIDSKNWQHELLNIKNLKDKRDVDLKIVAKNVAIRMFPQFSDMISKFKDVDSLLICEWKRRHIV